MKYSAGAYTVAHTRVKNPTRTHTRTFSRLLKGGATTVDPWGF